MSPLQVHRLAAIGCAVFLTAAAAGPSGARTLLDEPNGASSVGAASAPVPARLTLPAAIDLALASQPELRVAGANVAIARADSQFAGLPVFNPELGIQSARGGRTLGSGSEATLDIGISQEFELWGKRSARRSAAELRSRASAAELRAKRQDIESEVRARFERALFLQGRRNTVDELTDLDRQVVRASQARVRDGTMTPVTGRLTELDLLRLEAQGRRARSDVRQALVALGLAIGLELPDSTRLDGDMQADSLDVPEDSVVAVALRTRKTGEALRLQIAQRQAELHLAERDGHPNLTLGLGLTRERRSFSSDDFTGDPAIVGGITGASSTDNLWSVRIVAPLPLWQRNQAGRARAAAEMALSQADYDRYRLQTQLAALGAARRFQDAGALYRIYLERSMRVQQDLALVRAAYSDGRIPLDSYLTQKGRLVDTLLGQFEAGDAYWDARGQLEATLGLDLAHINAGGVR